MPAPISAGLCASCRYAKTITSDRGSVFALCELSKSDPHFPKYPRLPVLACTGWKPEGSPPTANA
jgi:hypothetical protein